MAIEPPNTETTIQDAVVVCQTSQGVELRSPVTRLTRLVAVFDAFSPFSPFHVAEALTDFRILIGERLVYSGRAVITQLINAGTGVVVEASLEDSWLDVDMRPSTNGASKLRSDFVEFMRTSQDAFRVTPEFKLVVADMQIFLQNLQRWMDQIELAVLSQPAGSREQFEQQVIQDLQAPILPMLGMLFERFETVCRDVPSDLIPAHRLYVKRQLHPLVLCAPFMYRTFQKPLGYAGDYEMVNMMTRDPREGASVFAKVLNSFFLSTPPVVAHRNRISLLETTLQNELLRTSASGQTAKIFNLGCGPAKEIQNFVANSLLSNSASFTLLDFSEEAIAHTGKTLSDLIQQHNRRTTVQILKKSVAQLLKEAAKPTSSLGAPAYDLVYCAGLFDYLPDKICEQLTSAFYRMVKPGGLLLVTNVDKYNPARNWMEYSVDWHLIYRDYHGMRKIIPRGASMDDCRIQSEESGVNIFLEVRKPPHA